MGGLRDLGIGVAALALLLAWTVGQPAEWPSPARIPPTSPDAQVVTLATAHVARAAPDGGAAAAALTAARLVGAVPLEPPSEGALRELARGMQGSDGAAVARGVWHLGATPYTMDRAVSGYPETLATCGCATVAGWRPEGQRTWSTLVFTGSLGEGSLVSDARQPSATRLDADALAAFGRGDDLWVVAACPSEDFGRCRELLCVSGATGPTCDGALPEREVKAPLRSGYAMTVEAAHVYDPDATDDCGPTTAVVAARLLGLVDPEVEDIAAIDEMRARMGTPGGGTRAGDAARGMRALGAQPRTIPRPTPASLALAVDCGCPTYFGYQNRDGRSRHAVLLARHRAGEEEEWLVSSNGAREPGWRSLATSEARFTRGRPAAVAFCPAEISPSCARQMDAAFGGH